MGHEPALRGRPWSPASVRSFTRRGAAAGDHHRRVPHGATTRSPVRAVRAGSPCRRPPPEPWPAPQPESGCEPSCDVRVAIARANDAQRLVGGVARRPAEHARAFSVDMTGILAAMSSQPGSVGCRRSSHVTSAAARSTRYGTGSSAGAEGAGDAVGVDDRLRGEVERPAGPAGRSPARRRRRRRSAWTTCETKRGASGRNGRRCRCIQRVGTQRPRKRPTISLAAAGWNTSPGACGSA